MIRTTDIRAFFDAEAREQRKHYDELMRLDIATRIRKRKAIAGLGFDSTFQELSAEGNVLLRFHAAENLSDFKEGEHVLLHEEGSAEGWEATLHAFTEEDDLILSFFGREIAGVNFSDWSSRDLVLDKSLVDLRRHVLYPFCDTLPADNDPFWDEQLFNRPFPPHFVERDAAERELEQMSKRLNLRFTPLQREAVLRCISSDDYYLIQGPPGTGKSFILGVVILMELLYHRSKVVVVGPNHMAINNTLRQVLRLAPQLSDRIIKVGQLYDAEGLGVEVAGEWIEPQKQGNLRVAGLNRSEDFFLIGMTPFTLFTRRARGLEYDTLIIDEAGQETIPVALMAMLRPRKIIMAGDHKQLPPIIASDAIPEELRPSIFERVMTPKNHTMLNLTFRMRGPICAFVSDLFYEGRLHPLTAEASPRFNEADALLSFAHPVVLHHVADDGMQISECEAKTIANLVSRYLALGLSPREIGILSPFRAQVALIRRHTRRHVGITEEAFADLAIDTVDKMQGQEREVVLLSLVAGDRDYMREMGEFLYNPNKLNVAFSRAKSKLIIVGNLDRLRELPAEDYPHIARMLHSPHAEQI